jgi:hypothetical protein
MTSTSRPPSLPSSVLTARLNPLRSCCPSTAGGPDKVAMMPTLSFSCAWAAVIASTTAAAASGANLFISTSCQDVPNGLADNQASLTPV